jgi:multidrug efflux pump
MELPILADTEATLRLKDLGQVRKGYKEAQSIARNHGVKSVSLEISKRLGQNVIHTTTAVRAVVETLQKQWPEAVKITFAQDDSEKILDMVKDLKNHLISAVLLVMVIMVMSLGLRSALLVGIAIPGSFLTGILMIGLMGFSINIVVLFGLILSIGMLVDGAIIVVEYADRKMAEGMNASEAYALAAGRMLWPVITSITTILVVFLPLIFWPGVVGEFMKYLPYTLLATLTASLLMALVFVPTLGNLFGKLSLQHEKAIQMIRLSESGDLTQLTGLPARYYRALNTALDHPLRVVLGAVGLLVLVLFAYGKLGKGVQFFPEVEPDSAAVLIHARGNTSLAQKDQIVAQVESRMLDMKEFKSIYTTVLKYAGNNQGEDVIGTIALEFEDWQKRRPAQEVLDDALSRVTTVPGVVVEIAKEGGGPSSGKPIQLELSGANLEILTENFMKLKAFLATVEGIKDIEDNLPTQDISWEITVDRAQAASYGVDVRAVGNAIKMVTNGVLVSHYRPNESRNEVDIVVRFDEAHRSLNTLDRLRIRTAQGMVPLKTFVTRSAQKRLGMIYRTNGTRVLTLKADMKTGFYAHGARATLKTWSQANLNPEEVRLVFAGEDEDENQTKNFLLSAFGIAIFMMTLILVTQFNSFFSAMLILSSIVMSTIGVFIGLIVMQVPFSIVMCGIGIIALAGIIVSNNIILIDTFDHLSATLKDKREAIVRTGVQRLRPVILTKLTAILGLLPIMCRLDIDYIGLSVHFKSPSTLWWQQIAISIVFGVAFASLLTLFVTPCALMIRENRRKKK